MSTGTMTANDSASPVQQESQSYWALVRKRFRRNRMAMFGCAMIMVLLTIVIFGRFYGRQ